MAQTFFPVLSHFQNNNPWSARLGRLHYWITPSVVQDEYGDPVPGEGSLEVQLWEGPWAREFSVIEETRTFPLTQESVDAIPVWLEERSREINGRPERSLEENIARRVEPES